MSEAKNILITGGSGFIGRNLVEKLSQRFQLFAPSHKKLDLLDGEKVAGYIKRHKIDTVVHAASVGGGRDTVGMLDVVKINLQMFFNIVANERVLKKIIHFGSGAEFDKTRDLVKVKEEELGRRIPKDDYGFYKYVCARYIRNSQKIVNLRLFGVYGKRENYLYKFISNAIIKNLFKMDIIINQNVVFDYLFIDDLLKVVEYFLANESRYKDYNVTPDESIDLIAIAKIINSVSNFQSKIKILHKGLNYQYTGSNKRLKKEISNLTFTSYHNGIKNLFLYYRSILSKIDKRKIEEDKYLRYCKIKNLN